jgi:hypothetical protein
VAVARSRSASGSRPASMNPVLGTIAQCGDRPRRQGIIDEGAQCDCVHAEKSYRGICSATREAEKGKASNVVSNVVPLASQLCWQRAWQLELSEGRERIPTGQNRSTCKDTTQSVTASWTLESGSRACVDAGVCIVGQSLRIKAVPGDPHRRSLQALQRGSWTTSLDMLSSHCI